MSLYFEREREIRRCWGFCIQSKSLTEMVMFMIMITGEKTRAVNCVLMLLGCDDQREGDAHKIRARVRSAGGGGKRRRRKKQSE